MYLPCHGTWYISRIIIISVATRMVFTSDMTGERKLCRLGLILGKRTEHAVRPMQGNTCHSCSTVILFLLRGAMWLTLLPVTIKLALRTVCGILMVVGTRHQPGR
mgnify:CR=1 FL=1